jgi:hypothetical protein
MAQQSARRGRENQGFPQRFEHAAGEMDPARELPYRPAAAQRRIRGRTDGSIRLRAKVIPKFPLARKGASTEGRPSDRRSWPYPLERETRVFFEANLTHHRHSPCWAPVAERYARLRKRGCARSRLRRGPRACHSS